jgi:hypothetical protein
MFDVHLFSCSRAPLTPDTSYLALYCNVLALLNLPKGTLFNRASSRIFMTHSG